MTPVSRERGEYNREAPACNHGFWRSARPSRETRSSGRLPCGLFTTYLSAMSAPGRFWRTLSPCFVSILLVFSRQVTPGQPFTLEGPGVDTNDFRVTVFATGLNNPMGLARLSDGSLLVTASQGANFFSTAGRLLRLTDTNYNGVADEAGTVLYSGLPTAPTAVCVASNLVLTTGSGKPITVLRAGATPASPLSLVGQFGFAYPSPPNWGHQNVAMTVRTYSGYTNR